MKTYILKAPGREALITIANYSLTAIHEYATLLSIPMSLIQCFETEEGYFG